MPGSGADTEGSCRTIRGRRQHDLQNPENRREILADAKLEPVFGKKKVTMLKMSKHPTQHLK